MRFTASWPMLISGVVGDGKQSDQLTMALSKFWIWYRCFWFCCSASCSCQKNLKVDPKYFSWLCSWYVIYY